MRGCDDKLSEIFAKFAGREIDVNERAITHRGQERIIPEIVEGNKNPLVLEMNAYAQEIGLKLGVSARFPTTPMQAMYPEVCAEVQKAADGKYRIGEKFIGNNVISLHHFM